MKHRLKVDLHREPGQSFGFGIAGGADNLDSKGRPLPIKIRTVDLSAPSIAHLIVHQIHEDGVARHQGSLAVGDEIETCNGHNFRGITHADAVTMLQVVHVSHTASLSGHSQTAPSDLSLVVTRKRKQRSKSLQSGASGPPTTNNGLPLGTLPEADVEGQAAAFEREWSGHEVSPTIECHFDVSTGKPTKPPPVQGGSRSARKAKEQWL